MKNNIDLVKKFIDAWNRLDWDSAYGMMDEHIVCHNMPMDPISGRANVRAFLESFGETTSANWRITAIASAGDTVLTERIDDFEINGKQVSLPVMGTFEFKNGLMVAWRDYFDLLSLQKQL